ncbi:hypothetical protein [Nodularia sphaerocarpa]|nr:hypothetical protein [Nodularia sphaerocarpa]MDB9373351.1 hypothetical protein [Nodularia sphaerocarpa CS-585]MDB9378807.1 hypothetical protein [Nodularia sphaerocarpa CS-585A2]
MIDFGDGGFTYFDNCSKVWRSSGVREIMYFLHIWQNTWSPVY